MRCIAALTNAALAVLTTFVVAPAAAAQGKSPTAPPAAAQAPVTYWAVCRARAVVVAGLRHSYVSGIMLEGNMTEESLSKAFAGFLATKYGADNAGPECRTADSSAGAQSQYKVWMDENATYHDAQGEPVETGWKYAPPTPATSPAAQPGTTPRPSP